MLDAWNAGNDPAEAGVDGVLADLGVSSHQFDTAERGFSFRFEAPLDMRMNTEASLTAADVVNTYPREEIEKILRLYGEVDNPGRIARLIESGRAAAAIRTTGDLDKCIAPAVPEFQSHKILAKIYQALRIEVNHEMRSLEKFLSGAAEALLPGGRLVVITYHSLEDRMVKNFIKAGNIRGEVEKDFYGNVNAPLRAVNRKPVLPSEEEISSNTRVFKSILEGKLLMRLGAEKLFPYFLYVFVLFWLAILFDMASENVIARAEKNRAVIKELSIKHAQKMVILKGFDRASTVDALLDDLNSGVGVPEKPAVVIDKRRR